MSSPEQALVATGLAVEGRPRPARFGSGLHGAERKWAIAFVLPYVGLFAAFVIYPTAYAFWMGARPALYAELFSDPRYARAAINTVVFVGLAVNLQMAFALLLSGFFARRRRWMKILLVLFILPWTLPAVPAYISFHWMLVAYQQGLPDRLLAVLFGIKGPFWFSHGWLALATDIVAYVWKLMPLWALIFLGGRMAISQDLYDSAATDGASAWQQFGHITLPLLANLYLISTLISTIWAFGDYTPVLFVSDGAPIFTSDVFSTLGFHYWLEYSRPSLGVAAGLAVLPVLIPIALVLVRRLRTMDVLL